MDIATAIPLIEIHQPCFPSICISQSFRSNLCSNKTCASPAYMNVFPSTSEGWLSSVKSIRSRGLCMHLSRSRRAFGRAFHFGPGTHIQRQLSLAPPQLKQNNRPIFPTRIRRFGTFSTGSSGKSRIHCRVEGAVRVP